MRFLILSAGFVILTAFDVQAATVGTCKFDVQQLSFIGAPQTQAQCLLRKVRKAGHVDQAPADLPAKLEELIGRPVNDLKPRFRKLMAADNISEATIGGSLESGLSRAKNGNPGAPTARYFVIHDTSSPYLGNATAFPTDMNTSDTINRLSGFGGGDAKAHMFVNRLGKVLKGHDFSVPWRATKLETQVVGKPAKGLFLHIELIQPRRREPTGGPSNDQIAPMPGFTQGQYDKLALLYVAASSRSGTWLIPAFHAALDEGLEDAHDDPQNFELNNFASAVETLVNRLPN